MPVMSKRAAREMEPTGIPARVEAIDWTGRSQELDEHGCAVFQNALTSAECQALSALYPHVLDHAQSSSKDAVAQCLVCGRSVFSPRPGDFQDRFVPFFREAGDAVLDAMQYFFVGSHVGSLLPSGRGHFGLTRWGIGRIATELQA